MKSFENHLKLISACYIHNDRILVMNTKSIMEIRVAHFTRAIVEWDLTIQYIPIGTFLFSTRGTTTMLSCSTAMRRRSTTIGNNAKNAIELLVLVTQQVSRCCNRLVIVVLDTSRLASKKPIKRISNMITTAAIR